MNSIRRTQLMNLAQLSLMVLLQVGELVDVDDLTASRSTNSLNDQAELLGLVLDETIRSDFLPVLTVLSSAGNGGFLVELTNTPTAYVEKFFVQFPPEPSLTSPVPMLVAFHKFGSGALDITNNTSLEQECFDRNWFLVAPLGASTKSFSSIPSQLNTELVLELMLDRFGDYIDSERIYGVGFSMGGGNLLNYAARHVDPSRPMFAALLNHSGAVSLRHSYLAQSANQVIMETWFGGTPHDVPFEYARSSVINLYGQTDGGTIGPGPGTSPPTDQFIDRPNSLIDNISYAPLYLFRVQLDPLKHMSVQLDALGRHLALTGANFVYKVKTVGLQHSWSTLNEKVTLDWLSQFRLELPTAAKTLVDRDGTYFYFDIEQSAAGGFTRFDWKVDSEDNALAFDRTENLERLKFDIGSTGLSTTLPLKLHLTIADGSSDEILISGYESEPLSVIRDGLVSEGWRFNPLTKVLTILEHGFGRPHDWIISPD